MVRIRLIRMGLWLFVVRAAMVVGGSQWWWRSDRWMRSRASMMGALALATSMMGGLAIATSWVPSTSPHLSTIDGLSETWQYEEYASVFLSPVSEFIKRSLLRCFANWEQQFKSPTKNAKSAVAGSQVISEHKTPKGKSRAVILCAGLCALQSR